MKIHIDFILSPRVIYSLLSGFLAFAWLAYAYHVDLIFAHDGFLPVIWVDDLTRDFLYRMDMFKKAAFLHVYKFAQQYFNLYPESIVYGVIGFEIAVTAWAFFALSRELFPKSSIAVPFIVVLLAIASRARSMDLGRYDEPYFGGLYNNVPIALGIFGMVMCLRGRMLCSSLLLSGAVICHSVRGLIAASFVAAMCLSLPRRIPVSRLLFPALVFLAVVTAWTCFIYQPVNFAGSSIPDRTWFDFSKFGSFHLYPVDMGLFTFRHEERFTQLLSFTLLFGYYLLTRTSAPNRDADRQISAGILMMILMTALGVAISMMQPNVMLVKLSLHRASDLLITVGLVYVVHGLWSEIQTAAAWRKIVAVGLLVSPFSAPPGWPLYFSLLIALPPSIQSIRSGTAGWRVSIVLILCIINVASMLIYKYLNLSGEFLSVFYTGGFRLLVFLCAASIFYACFTRWSVFLRSDDRNRSFEVPVLLTMLLLSSWTLWNYRLVRPVDFATMTWIHDYKQAQLWAKENTPANALFMTDPTIYYGWREYSHRSSFGNLREWLHTGWIYSSDPGIYEEGIRRFQEFSISLDAYFEPEPTIYQFEKLSNAIKRSYYARSDSWRMNLSQKYGINYFVMENSALNDFSNLRTVYSNETFTILEASADPGSTGETRTVLSADFKTLADRRPGVPDWSTYSEGREITWPWGLKRDPSINRLVLYLEQPDNHDYWLYTGPGKIDEPPDASGGSSEYSAMGNRTYRVLVSLRGEGIADLYLCWFDPQGVYRNKFLLRMPLTNQVASWVRLFRMPGEAKEYRLAFLLRKNSDTSSHLFIYDFSLETLDP